MVRERIADLFILTYLSISTFGSLLEHNYVNVFGIVGIVVLMRWVDELIAEEEIRNASLRISLQKM